jgi:hypothetical protein
MLVRVSTGLGTWYNLKKVLGYGCSPIINGLRMHMQQINWKADEMQVVVLKILL